jgi:hypothetical protein
MDNCRVFFAVGTECLKIFRWTSASKWFSSAFKQMLGYNVQSCFCMLLMQTCCFLNSLKLPSVMDAAKFLVFLHYWFQSYHLRSTSHRSTVSELLTFYSTYLHQKDEWALTGKLYIRKFICFPVKHNVSPYYLHFIFFMSFTDSFCFRVWTFTWSLSCLNVRGLTKKFCKTFCTSLRINRKCLHLLLRSLQSVIQKYRVFRRWVTHAINKVSINKPVDISLNHYRYFHNVYRIFAILLITQY